MSRAYIVLLVLIAATSAVAATALAFGNPPDQNDASFHRLVGGLGGGRAFDLSRCAIAFDSRLDSTHDIGAAAIP